MCFDKCLKGREGKCCFGCSTRFGISLISIMALAEVGLIGYLFFNQLGDGIFNLKVFTWLFISFMRVLAYFSMCFDGISKRKCYLWTLIFTTAIEVVMFTILNIGLFDGEHSEVVFKLVATWGMGEAV